MRIEELRRMMAEVGAEDEYVRNFEKYHCLKIENFEYRFSNVSMKDFVMHFNEWPYSFNWNETDEGCNFWRCKYYQLIYRYMEEEVRLVKQAVLLLRKEGYVLVEDSHPFMHRRHFNLGLSVEKEKVAYCVLRIGRLSLKISYIEYIRKAKKMLTDCGIYKSKRFYVRIQVPSFLCTAI